MGDSNAGQFYAGHNFIGVDPAHHIQDTSSWMYVATGHVSTTPNMSAMRGKRSVKN